MNDALNILLMLTRLSISSMQAAQEVSDIIRKAHKDNRDLSPDELEKIKSFGDQALDRWFDGDA